MAIGAARVAIELLLRLGDDYPFRIDQADDRADREGATAKTESADLVTRFVIATEKLVNIDDIALEAPAEEPTPSS
jgi:hypothetical protein